MQNILNISPLAPTLLLVAGASILLCSVALIRLLIIQRCLLKTITVKYEDLNKRIKVFGERLELVQEHAIDYMNSLSGEGTRALYQLQKILSTQREIIAEVEQLGNAQDVISLQKANRLLDYLQSKANVKPSASPSVDPPPRSDSLLDNWEPRSEELLQLLGLDVSLASDIAKRSGLPKRRKRQHTSLSLEEAGILAALRGGKVPEKPN